MLASDVWIEKLAILSRKDAIYSVDPLSSEDVAVVGRQRINGIDRIFVR